MSKKQELTFIEVARAVAIFFVVMIHPIDRLADEANPDTVAISTFVRFAVPFSLSLAVISSAGNTRTEKNLLMRLDSCAPKCTESPYHSSHRTPFTSCCCRD